MTSAEPELNHFDRSKPFYPLVMHYLAQLMGFKDLALQGVVGPASLDDILSRYARKHGNADPVDDDLLAKLTTLVGPLQLRSEFQGNTIDIAPALVQKELAENASYLASYLMRAAGALLILAHEITKTKPYRDKGPLWEFLRHCRNAAAHGGSFTLAPHEPRNPAMWGSFEVTRRSKRHLAVQGCHGLRIIIAW